MNIVALIVAGYCTGWFVAFTRHVIGLAVHLTGGGE